MAPIFIVTWLFNHVVLLDHVTNWKHYISNTTISMATKLLNMVAYHEELALIILLDTSTTWFCEIMWHIKYYISPLPLDQWPPNTVRWSLVATKHCEEDPPINPHNFLNKCWLEVMRQIKKIISSLSQCLWSQDLSQGWHATRSFHP